MLQKGFPTTYFLSDVLTEVDNFEIYCLAGKSEWEFRNSPSPTVHWMNAFRLNGIVCEELLIKFIEMEQIMHQQTTFSTVPHPKCSHIHPNNLIEVKLVQQGKNQQANSLQEFRQNADNSI